mmetsp:Transcript_54847/g.107305  ORF Transcript_54847/g.107305 Transcript_54847/m.107305 type:complete len:80 (+) Transcript_54847:50-289(+)
MKTMTMEIWTDQTASSSRLKLDKGRNNDCKRKENRQAKATSLSHRFHVSPLQLAGVQRSFWAMLVMMTEQCTQKLEHKL